MTAILTAPKGTPKTMADWLEQSFGPTITKLFFGPFHERYTAGLWRIIAPQDGYKSPIDTSLIVQGAFNQTPLVGYNISFVYPIEGLNALATRMSEQCEIHYGKTVVGINLRQKEVLFSDGSGLRYDSLISTLPLIKMLEMTELEVDNDPDPYTSVLVLNIGATKGSEAPLHHWLYIPETKSGFHRVGFYSNVDASFLPSSSRDSSDRVSIYVERAYRGGRKPTEEEINAYANEVVQELQDWKFIEKAEVVDPTWIDVAYTWSYPDSNWRTQAIKRLEENDIIMVGRYGRWVFHGIADSIRDGFFIGSALSGRSVIRRCREQAKIQ